jgi:uncharacterized protein YbbC (DUF1343 family)
MRAVPFAILAAAAALLAGAATAGAQPAGLREPERLRPGISVLLDDQISVVRGRRVVLITDGSARDERGERVDDLLKNDKRARAARVVVVATWQPDLLPGFARGPFGTGTAADAARLADLGRTMDSVTAPAQTIVVDLMDDGFRTGAAPWVVLAALRAGAHHQLQVVLLDRPNPLTGEHVEGPAVDSLSGASDALYGLPARHGMTLGEIARWFNATGAIGASLTVVPVRGWRRSTWATDRVALPRQRDGSQSSVEQLAMFGALVPLAETNLLVATGPGRTIVRVGAPWLRAKGLADLLNDRLMAGVKFRSGRDDFTGANGASVQLPCVYVDVTDRDRASGLRVLAGMLAEVHRLQPDALRFAAAFDRAAGSDAVRLAVLTGEDSDAMADRQLANVVDFRRRVRGVLLYR